MTQCSEQEVARLMDIVSPQRREQALSYKHLFGQFCCLKSYEMLMQLLASSSFTLPFFLYNEHGQPSIEGGPCFSISHCKQGIAVVISECNIGIDIEHVRILKPELVARTMNENEQDQIYSSAYPEIEFIRLWTQKEAVLKMRGTGITSIDGIKNTLVGIEDVDFQTKVNLEKQYVYTIAERSR